jgi:UDP-2-acetamido-2,6-beta-L-arabino-hexul-4-ose reductase
VKKVGITGQTGFIGTHLYNHIGLRDEFERVDFQDEFFNQNETLNAFVKDCDVIVHFAAMNRHENENVIYETNIRLVKDLISAMEEEKVTPHIIFSSSTQEESDNLYGKSKLEGRLLFEDWAKRNNARFSGLVIPNVFGPFGKPYYNSFVATFCHQLNVNEVPEIKVDGDVKLIYVGSLCNYILDEVILNQKENIERVSIPHDFQEKVTSVLSKLANYKEQYLEKGIVPELKDRNEINLFNTFTSFINFKKRYPCKLQKHSDNRGDFIEVIRLGIGGQVSFSTTVPGITRGNHFHTRKIERFIVIKGRALIELRKIGTKDKLQFELDGNEPSYVDMPIWYTHNIKNIGDDVLYTQFWINEHFDPADPDTFFEEV